MWRWTSSDVTNITVVVVVEILAVVIEIVVLVVEVIVVAYSL